MSEQLQINPLTRKERTEKFLVSKGIEINKHLPCVEAEEETKLRTPAEVAARVVVLAITNLVAFDTIDTETAEDYIERFSLSAFVTPNEKAFLKNPTKEKKFEESWKCEGIWTLMWALKVVDELGFPDELCNLNEIPLEKYPIGEGKDPNNFINSFTKLRTKTEILDANDLYYRLNWACVHAALNNKEITGIEPGVVNERQYALNWLINYMDQDWDDITCDT